MVVLGSAMRETVDGWHGGRWGQPCFTYSGLSGYHASSLRSVRTVDHHGKEWSIRYRGSDALPVQPMRFSLDTNPDMPHIDQSEEAGRCIAEGARVK